MIKAFFSRLERIISLLESIAAPPALRPCWVDGYNLTEPCRFHGIVADDQALLKINAFVMPQEADALHRQFKKRGIIPSSCSAETIRRTFALIELPSGQLRTVEVSSVTFLDTEESTSPESA